MFRLNGKTRNICVNGRKVNRMNMCLERFETVSVMSYFKDFAGDVRQWQESYFELMTTMNTWGTIRDMYINSNSNGPFIRLVLSSKDNAARITRDMDGMGYRNIKVTDIVIAELTVDDPELDSVYLT